MQVKNNYDIDWEKESASGNVEVGKGVFNGEIGTITLISERDKIVEIRFDDDKTAYYDYSELDQIEHSYAITIHKAQRKWIWCSNYGSPTICTNIVNKKLIIYWNN